MQKFEVGWPCHYWRFADFSTFYLCDVIIMSEFYISNNASLVLFTGVTSNTDAAQLAETFAEAKCQTKVLYPCDIFKK